MEPLDRFLTCIIKDMNESGFLETLESYVEFSIRKVFETVADIAVFFFKDILRKGFYYFKFARSSEEYTKNGIFSIIYELIINMVGLNDFNTICRYIKAAIDLLNKLLRRNNFVTSTPYQMKEITPNEKNSTIPTKSSNSNNYKYCEPNSKNKADIGARSSPVTELKNTSQQSPIQNSEKKADIGVGSAPVTEIKNTSQESSPVKSIVGTRRVKNTNFKGVERKISYYVGNVYLSASEQNIVDYLKKMIPGGSFYCIKLKTTHRTQSFKVTANLSLKEKLEDPNNWPVGVKVRPWVQNNKIPRNTMHDTMADKNRIRIA